MTCKPDWFILIGLKFFSGSGLFFRKMLDANKGSGIGPVKRSGRFQLPGCLHLRWLKNPCEARLKFFYFFFIWVAEASRFVLAFRPLICLSEGHTRCVHTLVLTASQGEVFDVTLVEHVMDLRIFSV